MQSKAVLGSTMRYGKCSSMGKKVFRNSPTHTCKYCNRKEAVQNSEKKMINKWGWNNSLLIEKQNCLNQRVKSKRKNEITKAFWKNLNTPHRIWEVAEGKTHSKIKAKTNTMNKESERINHQKREILFLLHIVLRCFFFFFQFFSRMYYLCGQIIATKLKKLK